MEVPFWICYIQNHEFRIYWLGTRIREFSTMIKCYFWQLVIYSFYMHNYWNGTCSRVFLVKLEPHQSVADLPAPEDFHVSSYEEVHHSKKGGVYVAEMFERWEISHYCVNWCQCHVFYVIHLCIGHIFYIHFKSQIVARHRCLGQEGRREVLSGTEEFSHWSHTLLWV
jgi:hypothetical protein